MTTTLQCPKILREKLSFLDNTFLSNSQVLRVSDGFDNLLRNHQRGDFLVSATTLPSGPGFCLSFTVQQDGDESQEDVILVSNIEIKTRAWLNIVSEIINSKFLSDLRLHFIGDLLDFDNKFIELCRRTVEISKQYQSVCVVPYPDWKFFGYFGVERCRQVLRNEGYNVILNEQNSLMFIHC